MDKRKRIAFDIDNTITEDPKIDIWNTKPKDLLKVYRNLKPDKEMIEIVNKFYDKGNIVYLFTARNDMFQRVTKKWLDKNGVKYHYFITNKQFYDLYVGDKAVSPEQLKLLENGQ